MAVIGPLPVQTASSGDTTSEALMMLAALVALCGALVLCMRCWTGREFRAVTEYQRTHRPETWTLTPSLRKYRSKSGSIYLQTFGMTGFALFALADLVRLGLGRGPDWWLLRATSVSCMVLLAATAVTTVVYRAFGLPDALRPPCQRGWERQGKRLVLVRPGTSEREREERRAIEFDPAYRDLVAQRRARRQARRDPWADPW
ncbi:MAG TPA: hypothetical protein VKB57_13615 [Acidimicrobiales bacterium]|nr:hypothetical protein [Acidimicrobiales bacterium]